MRAGKVTPALPRRRVGEAAKHPAVGLQGRLQARRGEIEQAILARVYGVSDPSGTVDPEYVQSLHVAVAAGIDYGLAGIVSTERNPPPIPAVLLVQARIAARNGISLDTVLRRYVAGNALLGDFILEEAQAADLLDGVPLRQLLRTQAPLLDRLLAAVSEEHARDSMQHLDTAAEHRAELVERLLAGERIDASGLAYDLDGSHLGLVARGPGAEEALRELAAPLDRRLLLVRGGEDEVWAWLGGRRPLEPTSLEGLIATSVPAPLCLALGEPGEGLEGWRLSHRQARAALPIARREGKSLVRYADVALLAAVLRDDIFATSLQELYLVPLEKERDGGEAARGTLRAYFASWRNVSSAAAQLGVSRQTVASRLRGIEARLGRAIDGCAIEVEAALRLHELPVASSGAFTA
jgi:hypothetical protein